MFGRGSERRVVRKNTACIEESSPSIGAIQVVVLSPTARRARPAPKIFGASVMLLQCHIYNNASMNTIYESFECAQDLVLRPSEFLSYFLSIVSVYYIKCIFVKLNIESLVR